MAPSRTSTARSTGRIPRASIIGTPSPRWSPKYGSVLPWARIDAQPVVGSLYFWLISDVSLASQRASKGPRYGVRHPSSVSGVWMGSVPSTKVVGLISSATFLCALPFEEVASPRLIFRLAVPTSLQESPSTTTAEISRSWRVVWRRISSRLQTSPKSGSV
jgi:hypothetical protein